MKFFPKNALGAILALVFVAMFMVACGSPVESNTPTPPDNYIENDEPVTPPDVTQPPQPPSGLQPEDENMFTHIFDSELNGLRITQYHGELTQVMIPDEIMGFPIVAIDGATFDVLNVTDVFFPDTVQYFGWGGGRVGILTNDEKPTSWTIPHGVTHLYRVQATSVHRTSTSIGTNVRHLDIPPTVQYIGEFAFSGFSSLTSLTIPYGVNRINRGTFNYTRSLLVINFPPTIEYVHSETGLLNTSWWAMQPDGIVYVGSVAFRWNGDMTSNTAVEIREGTTSIADSAFRSTPLTSIVIPDSVTHIGNSAFRETQLTDVIIPNGITSIDQLVFSDTPLISVYIPDGVTRMSINAFFNTQLTNINIPDSVTFIAENGFGDTPLNEATQARIREIQGQ